MLKKALVLGATGLVGKQLLTQLLENDHYSEVHILIRHTWPQAKDKLKVHQVDFDKLDAHAALFKVDDIYCCLGSTMAKAGSKEEFYRVDHTYIVSAARLGKQQGARQFLLISSIGANAGSAAFYTKVKGQTEDAVKVLTYSALHIFRPSFLDGDRNERRLAEKAGIYLTRWINKMGLLKAYQPVKDHELARAMCHVAQQNNSGFKLYDNLQIVALGRKTNNQ